MSFGLTNAPADPHIRPLVEQDSKSLQRLLPEIPLWVKNPDYDRVDWLNKFLEHMWPYLDKAICKTAKNIAKPIIAEQIPKYKIESVEFEALTLGRWFLAFLVSPIYLSLMEKPHVDFGLKLLGADLMSIPGAYRFVQNPELKLDTTEDSEKSANSEKSAEVSYEDDNDVNTD
ncbi:hypothetical protein POM88_045321 [Heracleum sosnowskyi]|uniref:SMP-LTD domain-containing protein n=1 Tax=Heracleum sosnowskyi TaxID=360622 RepID=A0AAD8H4B4_9APIA|nr:hypothetical protein POM88_045321 [Heracleum sosnowskyi]